MAPSFLLPRGRRAGPLTSRLYEAIRAGIAAGNLGPGERLPSIRQLSRELQVARNTVVNAFERLLAEGYLETRRGAGTFVAAALPDAMLIAPPTEGGTAQPPGGARSVVPASLSSRGRAIASALLPFRSIAPAAAAFRLGTPALDAFPAKIWGQLLARRWDRSSAALLRDVDNRGYAPLRAALADYLVLARGVRCRPDDILVTAGAQQAFTLVAQILLDPGDEAWVEDPGYTAARAAIVAAGGVPRAVPVDEEGLDVDAGCRLAPSARLAVVTPSHQFPLGVALSEGRRASLFAWAARRGAFILEDDYDSELRYVGRPLPALQGIAPDPCVIYVGTFSKVVSPSLRLGYLVASEALLDALLAAKIVAGVRTPILEQAVMSDFIEGGHFLRHVRRMRLLYQERRDAFERLVREELGDRARLRPLTGGMHGVIELAEATDELALQRRAAEKGIAVTPLGSFRMESRGPSGLALGFSAVPPEEQRRALRSLASVL